MQYCTVGEKKNETNRILDMHIVHHSLLLLLLLFLLNIEGGPVSSNLLLSVCACVCVCLHKI